MKKSFLWVSLGLLLFASACSDDKNEPNLPDTPLPETKADGVYILNQGNYNNKIEGELSYFDFSSQTVSNNVFESVNRRSLGDTPQCGIAYGSKVYLGVFGSNTIEVIDANDFKSIKQIKLDESTGTEPRFMIKDNGKVYISMFDGYVARLDTTTLLIDAKVKVGPNPEKIALYKGKIYVPNSDGNNWMVGYGTTASIIDIPSFKVESTITVPLNPETFFTCGDRLFLLSKGNYGDVEAAVYEIEKDIANIQKTSEELGFSFVAKATLAAASSDKIYLINSPFKADGIMIEYSAYNVVSSKIEPWEPSGISYPSQIAIDKNTGNTILTSYIMDGPFPSYIAPGYAVVYDSNGSVIKRFNIGAGPAAIFF